MDERAAFEAGIDAAPHDATNHLVYADWLQEHGEQDEADFRRAMGEWIQRRSGNIRASGTSGFSLGRSHPWFAWYADLPDGVSNELVTRDGRNLLDPPSEDHSDGREYGRAIHYPSYRGMEEGFKRAFTTLRQNPHNKLSRRQLVLKYGRK